MTLPTLAVSRAVPSAAGGADEKYKAFAPARSRERQQYVNAPGLRVEDHYVGGQVLPMRYVVIVGSGGAGKSTLARQLGALLGLQVVHLDALYWQSDWQPIPAAEWQRIQEDVIQLEGWIIEGEYLEALDLCLTSADTIIHLDLPRSICLARAVRRRLRSRGQSRPDQIPDRLRKPWWMFAHWLWTYPYTRRPAVVQTLDRYRLDRRVVILRTSTKVRHFMRKVRHATAHDSADLRATHMDAGE